MYFSKIALATSLAVLFAMGIITRNLDISSIIVIAYCLPEFDMGKGPICNISNGFCGVLVISEDYLVFGFGLDSLKIWQFLTMFEMSQVIFRQ